MNCADAFNCMGAVAVCVEDSCEPKTCERRGFRWLLEDEREADKHVIGNVADVVEAFARCVVKKEAK